MSNGIGERIRKLREEKGLTQQQLAKKMYVKRETVNQWENETRDLKTGYTISLADFFGVTCDYILRGVKSENVDINRELNISDATIESIKNMAYSTKSVYEFLACNGKLLNILCNYFYSYLYDEIKKKPYCFVPLKKKSYPYFGKIMFSNLIERLPEIKEEFVENIKSDNVLNDSIIMKFLCKNADLNACDNELYNIYGYSFFERTDKYLVDEPIDEKTLEEVHSMEEFIGEDYEEAEAYIEELKQEELETADIIEKILEMKKAGETNGNGN